MFLIIANNATNTVNHPMKFNGVTFLFPPTGGKNGGASLLLFEGEPDGVAIPDDLLIAEGGGPIILAIDHGSSYRAMPAECINLAISKWSVG